VTTTEQQGTDLTPQALATWAQLRDIQARKAELLEQEEALKATLREHLGAGTYTVAGRPAFSITPQRKFSETAARDILTPDEVAACTVPVLDRGLVQKTLSPERYSACQVEQGKPVVRSA
jgi:hypothetical protein